MIARFLVLVLISVACCAAVECFVGSAARSQRGLFYISTAFVDETIDKHMPSQPKQENAKPLAVIRNVEPAIFAELAGMAASG